MNVSVNAIEYDQSDPEIRSAGEMGLQVVSEITQDVSIGMDEGVPGADEAWNSLVIVESKMESIKNGRKLSATEAEQLGSAVTHLHYWLDCGERGFPRHVKDLRKLIDRLNGAVFACDY